MNNTKCPKCGQNGLPAKFCTGGKECRASVKTSGEHIDLVCPECGYISTTPCKDAS